jgi:hypothetical protein
MLQVVVLSGLTALALCYFVWQWRSGALARPAETQRQAAATHPPSFLPRPILNRTRAPQRANVATPRRGVRRFRAAA